MNGTIRKILSDKGFGFIATGDGTDYFFHHSGVLQRQFDQLHEGQSVSFDLDVAGARPGKGPRAVNVQAVGR